MNAADFWCILTRSEAGVWRCARCSFTYHKEVRHRCTRSNVPNQPVDQFAEAGPCPHRLPIVRREVCQTCGQRGQIADVFGCTKHGECTLRNRGLRGVQNCLACPDY